MQNPEGMITKKQDHITEMKTTGKKAVIAAAICGFLAGNMVSLQPASAGGILDGLGKVAKTGGIVWLVDRYGNELNTFYK